MVTQMPGDGKHWKVISYVLEHHHLDYFFVGQTSIPECYIYYAANLNAVLYTTGYMGTKIIAILLVYFKVYMKRQN